MLRTFNSYNPYIVEQIVLIFKFQIVTTFNKLHYNIVM
jgi:hypothetical protein